MWDSKQIGIYTPDIISLFTVDNFFNADHIKILQQKTYQKILDKL